EHVRSNSGVRFSAGRGVDVHMRAMVAKSVSASARSAMPRFDSDQGEVWREISAKEQRAARRSVTSALHDLYESEAAPVEDYVRAFPVPEGANGVAVGIGGKVIALDMFDSAETLQKQWPRLIASAASA